jgi:hypothetical protein
VFYYSNYKSIRILSQNNPLWWSSDTKKMDTNTAYLLTILQKNDGHRENFFHLAHLTSELMAGLWHVNIKKCKFIGSAIINCLYAHN